MSRHVQADLDAAGMKALRPIQRLRSGEVVPLDTNAVLAIAPMQTLPTATEGVPDAGFGEIASGRLMCLIFWRRFIGHQVRGTNDLAI